MKNLLLMLTAASILLAMSCSKKDNPVPVIPTAPSITISSISPTSGGYDTTITITGTNFSTTLINNIVKFNGMQAVVLSASATTIKAVVPAGAGTGIVSVATDASPATTGPTFTYNPTPTTYFAGYDGYYPVYWRNGKEYFLPITGGGGYVSAMATSGTDVYIAGRDGDKAVYWKNGVENVLQTSSGTNGAIDAIAINGTDVYFAGRNNGNYVYWKNGVENVLPTNTKNLNNLRQVNAIAVSGTDLYVLGIDSSRTAYWKNGVETILPTPFTGLYGGAYYMAVSGTDIYTSGYDGPNSVYWKNGIEHNITFYTDYQGSSYLQAMAVIGSDIYFVGYDYPPINNTGEFVYWKNGNKTVLNILAPNTPIVNSISVSGTDLYFMGETIGTNQNGIYMPMYMKNGVVYTLPYTYTTLGGGC